MGRVRYLDGREGVRVGVCVVAQDAGSRDTERLAFGCLLGVVRGRRHGSRVIVFCGARAGAVAHSGYLRTGELQIST